MFVVDDDDGVDRSAIVDYFLFYKMMLRLDGSFDYRIRNYYSTKCT